jgi:hypothetical protein
MESTLRRMSRSGTESLNGAAKTRTACKAITIAAGDTLDDWACASVSTGNATNDPAMPRRVWTNTEKCKVSSDGEECPTREAICDAVTFGDESEGFAGACRVGS